MKKRYNILILALTLILIATVVFSACDTTSEQKYSVVFIADGKEIKTVETAGKEVISVPEAPEKEGFLFKGWYLDRWVWQEEFDGNNFADKAITQDVKVYAYYEEIVYKQIRFYADGKLIKTVESAGNETITLPSAPEKTDYEFKGWYLDENVWEQPFAEDYFADKATTEDVNVYAKYDYIGNTEPEPEKYSIKFYADGKLIKAVESAGNEIINLPSAPVKDDYEFKGWYLDENVWSQPFTADYFADKAVTADVSVYARYEELPLVEPTEYAIKFYADGYLVGTVMSAGNEVIILPTAPVKENYEFKGWYLDENVWSQPFTTDYFADKAVTANVSVYARYEELPPVEPTEYAIKFYADGNLVDTVMSAGNEIIELPSAPVKENYEFKGWYLDENVWSQPFTADYFADKAVTSDVNVYARYDYVEPTYTVTFDTDGGTPVDSVKVSVIQSEPVTTKDGYDFDGWYLDAEKTDKAVFPLRVAHDLTLYAKWTEKTVTFTLDADNRISGIVGTPINGELYIPGTVNGVKVEGIANYAFRWNSDLVKVTIDPSITYFGLEAFKGCSKLESINIPYGVTNLSEGMLSYCSRLKSIEIPDTVTSISRDVFSDSGITSLTLPSSVKSIGQYAFKNCKSLVSIDLGRVEVLGQGLFQNCSLLTSVVFPDTIKDMDSNYMFMGCYKLTQVVVPDIDVPLNYNFVNNTSYYNNSENWTDGVLYIGNHLVTVNSDFNNKTSYAVKEGTITVGRLAFYATNGQAKLTSLTLPDGLKKIGERAFEDCKTLSSANIPDSVVSIGKDAFNNTALIKSGQASYVGNWLIKYDLPSGETVVQIKEGTVGIADGEITSSQGSVTQVILPSTLRYIGVRNFSKMSNLTVINAPAMLESIGEYAFDSCKALTEFDLTDSVGLKSIGDTAFTWCSSLKSLYIPRSVEYIGDSAFNQTVALTLYIEREQGDIPSGWSDNWDSTAASVPINIVWGASSASVEG